MGFTPQLVDLDSDGGLDLISGSWPGQLFFFRRQADGSFAEGQPLKDATGQEINLGSASTVFAVDWDADSDLDLLVGDVSGKVQLVENESDGLQLRFGKARHLLTLPDLKLVDSHPVAADWDDDGRQDLLVGHSEGGVLLYRNVGSRSRPELAEPVTLIPRSPSPWQADAGRQPNDWGMRAKICVVDWNRDGRLDILLGDYCGGFSGKPDQTPDEAARERKALARLAQLHTSWVTTFGRYRQLSAEPSHAAHADDRQELKELLAELETLRDEIARCQRAQQEFQPQYQSHGFVWLFARKPADEP